MNTDDEKNMNESIQKITDQYIRNVEDILKDKEADLIQV